MTKRKLDLGWEKTCQKCKKVKETTRQRTFRTKNYVGPCGDSFCYASCNMDSCHPKTAVICEECLNLLKKPGT